MMTTMPQAMPRAMLGALHQASRKHSPGHRLRHAAGNAWRNASSYARTYERTYLRTLFKPWVDLSRNVSRAKCATIHPCPGAPTTLRARLTDRHRPCRQAVDELSTLVTAERDRQRRARRELDNLADWARKGRLATPDIAEGICRIADDLDGPADPNTDGNLHAQLTAERDRARWAIRELGYLRSMATISPHSERRRIDDIIASLEGPAPHRLNPADLSSPPAPTNPSAAR